MQVKCDNCDRIFDSSEIKIKISSLGMKALHERLTPGDPVPYGECNDCGAFVYVVDTMNYYQLAHDHKHGVDTHVFKSKTPMFELPSYEEIAEKLGVDYEPEMGEFLNLFALDLTIIKEL